MTTPPLDLSLSQLVAFYTAPEGFPNKEAMIEDLQAYRRLYDEGKVPDEQRASVDEKLNFLKRHLDAIIWDEILRASGRTLGPGLRVEDISDTYRQVYGDGASKDPPVFLHEENS